ncbi:hypothetical protein CLOLEP_02127 [[Clostridium] leptum DSM 753]|uniref:Uncharacterized protein n=1 Tax=[Clostridium] leptum DSM 753 TaxID=428125 RepID=A7VU81_9FIRM|nr:hypothetical protein CLOLEP_02127 [[Clostridium] leptum DSM 753]
MVSDEMLDALSYYKQKGNSPKLKKWTFGFFNFELTNT